MPALPDTRSPLQILAERFYRHLTGRQLAAVVAAARGRRIPWRHLAASIEQHTDGEVVIAWETLRRWYEHLDVTADAGLEDALRGLDAAADAALEAGDQAEVARLRGEERALLDAEVTA